jgi:hypothetical protein
LDWSIVLLSYGLSSVDPPFFKVGSFKNYFFFIIADSVDLEFSIVLAFIFYKENEGFDLILSGVLKSVS